MQTGSSRRAHVAATHAESEGRTAGQVCELPPEPAAYLLLHRSRDFDGEFKRHGAVARRANWCQFCGSRVEAGECVWQDPEWTTGAGLWLCGACIWHDHPSTPGQAAIDLVYRQITFRLAHGRRAEVSLHQLRTAAVTLKDRGNVLLEVLMRDEPQEWGFEMDDNRAATFAAILREYGDAAPVEPAALYSPPWQRSRWRRWRRRA